MEMVKVFNDHTGEILEKKFVDPADADDFEFILDIRTLPQRRTDLLRRYDK